MIGEHTDYNDGFVLPMAIDRWTAIALRAREDEQVLLHSLDIGASGSFSLRELSPGKAEGWMCYALGVAGALAETGVKLHGWEGDRKSVV